VLCKTATKTPAAATKTSAAAAETPSSPSGRFKNLNCKVCHKCTTPDCGNCKNCLDKIKFGGQSILRKRCVNRVCANRTDGVRADSADLSDVDSLDDEDEDDPLAMEEPESLTDFIEKGLCASPGKRAKEDYLTKHNFKEVPVPTVETSSISVNYTEEFDPKTNQLMGQGVYTSSSISVSLCFLCGSGGKDDLVNCLACAQTAHQFCASQGESTKESGSWICARCVSCKVCGDHDFSPEKSDRLVCCDCGNMYHNICLLESDRVNTKDKTKSWTCSKCSKCSGCGANNVKKHSKGERLCGSCCSARARGSYCPVCSQCYEDDDYESAMMECSKCSGWIHAGCEGLDGEQYQVLSLLPDSVQYICKCALPKPKQTNAAQTSDIRQILAAGPPSVWQRGVAPSTPPRAAAVHLPSPSVKLPFESEWIGEPLPSDAIDTEIDVGSMDLVGSVDFGSLESGDFVTLDVAEINESALQINGRTTF